MQTFFHNSYSYDNKDDMFMYRDDWKSQYAHCPRSDTHQFNNWFEYCPLFWHQCSQLLCLRVIVIKHLGTFLLNNNFSTFFVFLLRYPHLLEGSEWSENGTSDPRTEPPFTRLVVRHQLQPDVVRGLLKKFSVQPFHVPIDQRCPTHDNDAVVETGSYVDVTHPDTRVDHVGCGERCRPFDAFQRADVCRIEQTLCDAEAFRGHGSVGAGREFVSDGGKVIEFIFIVRTVGHLEDSLLKVLEEKFLHVILVGVGEFRMVSFREHGSFTFVHLRLWFDHVGGYRVHSPLLDDVRTLTRENVRCNRRTYNTL